MHDVIESGTLPNRWLHLIVTSVDPILPFFGSVVLYLVLAICVALPYKVQHWTTPNPAWVAYSAPRDPLAGFKAPTS